MLGLGVNGKKNIQESGGIGEGSARMPLARLLALEVWMSLREGRLQPMIFSAERTMRCSLSLSLDG